MSSYYYARIAAGLCTRCGRPLDNPRLKCACNACNDLANAKWRAKGLSKTGRIRGRIRSGIREYLETHRSATSQKIADFIGCTKLQAISSLSGMVREGKLIRTRFGVYSLNKEQKELAA